MGWQDYGSAANANLGYPGYNPGRDGVTTGSRGIEPSWPEEGEQCLNKHQLDKTQNFDKHTENLGKTGKKGHQGKFDTVQEQSSQNAKQRAYEQNLNQKWDEGQVDSNINPISSGNLSRTRQPYSQGQQEFTQNQQQQNLQQQKAFDPLQEQAVKINPEEENLRRKMKVKADPNADLNPKEQTQSFADQIGLGKVSETISNVAKKIKGQKKD